MSSKHESHGKKQNGGVEKETRQTVENPQQKEQQTPDLSVQLAALTEENEQLIAQIEKLTKTVARLQSSADNSDKYRDQLVALKSDFDSYKRRMKNDAEENREKGRAEVVEKILPVLDNFDLAKKHLDEQSVKAFDMVESQFVSILTALGAEIMDVAGQNFDAKTMNALATVDAGAENAGKVVEVYKKGYCYGGRVIRYAEVIVGKGE